jgi:hypothetical protein
MGFPIDHPGILKMLADGSAVDTTPSQVGESPLPPPTFGSEAEFQRGVVALARRCGFQKVAHFRKVRVQRKDGSVYWETPVAEDGKGFLDLMLVKPGRIVCPELKFGRNKPTPEQEAWHDLLRTVPGVEAYFWWPAQWAAIVAVLARP